MNNIHPLLGRVAPRAPWWTGFSSHTERRALPTTDNSLLLLHTPIRNDAIDSLGSAAASAAVRPAPGRTKRRAEALNGESFSNATVNREAPFTPPGPVALPLSISSFRLSWPILSLSLPRGARLYDDTEGVAELSPGLPESARATLGFKPLHPSLSRAARRAKRVSSLTRSTLKHVVQELSKLCVRTS